MRIAPSLLPALLPALILSACGSEPASEVEPVDMATDAPAVAGSPAPIPPPPGHEQDGMIPERYLGVWDYVKGTCDPASDMRIEISPRQIIFYEAVGYVAGVGEDSGDALVGMMIEGEGEQWFAERRLSLSDDGETLEVTDSLKPSAADPYPLKRCPA